MKLVKAFVHHVKVSAIVEALADAGYRNLTFQDVKGMLKPVEGTEQRYSLESGLVVSEVRISLVCDDQEVERVTNIIGAAGRIGREISGWIYVSPVDLAIPIGGSPDVSRVP